MEKHKFTPSEEVRYKRLVENLKFKEEDWSKEQVERYGKHTLINMIPVHDCIMVYECKLMKKETAGGIIIPDIARSSSSQVIGFVLGMSPGMEFGKGMTVHVGDYVLYDANRIKFSASLEGFEIPMLDAYSVLALLPPSIKDKIILLANPHTAFNKELVDIADAYEMAEKVEKSSMPKGMAQQDQEHQINDTDAEVDQNIMKEIRKVPRKNKGAKSIIHQVKKK
jgi:co-chaperonin GroES (HSP10)